MSAQSENRWRPAPTSRPQISRDRSNPSTTPQTRLAPPSNPSQGSQQTTHNAWTGAAAQDRNRSQSGARTGGAGKTAGGGPGSGGGGGGVAAGSAGVVEEKHVPVGGFNEAEVREYLGRAYQDAIANDPAHKSFYKPSVADTASTARPAWGSKPSTMANGQDFGVQLMKKINALENTRGG